MLKNEHNKSGWAGEDDAAVESRYKKSTLRRDANPLYVAALGEKSQEYYLKKFEYFDSKSAGINISWSWSAFIFCGIWAFYRKLYGWFFLFWMLSFLLSLMNPTAGLIILIPTSIVFAMFADSLYHRKLSKQIAKAKLKFGEDRDELIKHLTKKRAAHTWLA